MFLKYLVLAPTLLLLLGAGVLFIMRLFRSTVGYSWLLAAGFTLTAWALAIYTRFRLPTSLDLPSWDHVIRHLSTGSVTADRISWPMEMALAALLVAVVFTDSARYSSLTRAGTWAGSLLLISLGIFSSLANQPLVLVLGWTAMDAVELFLIFDTAGEARTTRQVIVSFGYRLAGTIIVLGTILTSTLDLPTAPGIVLGVPTTIALILGISLRLGALPLHAPFYRELPLRRGAGTIIRLAPAASALVYLARFTPETVSWGYVPGFLLLTAASGLYAAWMWLRSEDDLSGRPFWIIALASLALSCSLRGHNEGVIAWGAALIISGGILFLYSARHRGFILLPMLGLDWFFRAAIYFNGFSMERSINPSPARIGYGLHSYPGFTNHRILSQSLPTRRFTGKSRTLDLLDLPTRPGCYGGNPDCSGDRRMAGL